MQFHWGWAALAALALCVGLIWWTQPAVVARLLPAPAPAHRVHDRAKPHSDAGPTLYRWVDANGVVNITTSLPPAGRRFTIVRIDPNQNVVPLEAGNGK